MDVLKDGCRRSHENDGIGDQATVLDRGEGVRVENFPDRECWNRSRRSVGIQQVGWPGLEVDLGVLPLEQCHREPVRHG